MPRKEPYHIDMGCDIHAYLECKTGEHWSHVADLSIGRDYGLFALMAGVRRYSPWPDPHKLSEALERRGVSKLDDGRLSKAEHDVIVREACDNGITHGQPSFEEKGIPEKLSYQVERAYTFYVTDEDTDEEGTCSRKKAEQWLKNGSSVVWSETTGEVTRITSPDWHTPSWLSASEFEQVAARHVHILRGEHETYVDNVQRIIARLRIRLAEAEVSGTATEVKELKERIADEEDEIRFEPERNVVRARVLAIAAMMRELDKNGHRARLVFWFDN